MKAHKAEYGFLDIARTLAALLVALGHVRGLYFVSIRDVANPGLLTKAFYLLTSLQGEATIVFFVISGFLVGGQVWRQMANGRFAFTTYFIDRFSRIYIVLVPALLLSAILAFSGVHFFGGTRLYAQHPLFPSQFDTDWHWQQIPCHAAALQSILCDRFSFNPPLWSLGHEWFYYMLFPLLLTACYRPKSMAAKLAWTCIVCAGAFLVVPGIGFWLAFPLYWLLGTLSARMQGKVPLLAGMIALVLCLAAFPVASLNVLPPWQTNLWIALTFAAALSCGRLLSFSLLPGFWRWGAGFSYSLYAVHLPFGVFIAALFETLGTSPVLAQPDAGAFFVFGLTMALILLFSRAFAALTEDRTDAMRHWLKTRFATSSMAGPGGFR